LSPAFLSYSLFLIILSSTALAVISTVFAVIPFEEWKSGIIFIIYIFCQYRVTFEYNNYNLQPVQG
ncbi:MAG: hypothetical protein PHP71_10505, partial [Methanosarcina sp.]|nr:hypothetical protein [Methanosarcina sp.]